MVGIQPIRVELEREVDGASRLRFRNAPAGLTYVFPRLRRDRGQQRWPESEKIRVCVLRMFEGPMHPDRWLRETIGSTAAVVAA